MLKLMYITNDPDIAKIADETGVDRVWIDLEVNGKEQRQKNLDNVMVRQAYDMLRVTIRDIADELEIDLKNEKLDYKSAFNKGMDHVIKNHPEGLFK